MINYYKYLSEILISNKNKYLGLSELFNIFKDYVDDITDIEYIFYLHVMAFTSKYNEYNVKKITSNNKNIDYIGFFEEFIDEDVSMYDNISELSNQDQSIYSSITQESSHSSIVTNNSLDVGNSNNNLLDIIDIFDIVKFVINNKENEYFKKLLLNYYDQGNNIMHFLFLNGKSEEIEKLLDNDSLHLLIEKNTNNKRPIDFINKSTLTNVIQKCITNNLDVNNHTYEIMDKMRIIELNNNKLNLIVNSFYVLLGTTSVLFLFNIYLQ